MKEQELNRLARIILAQMTRGRGKELYNLLYYGFIALWKGELQNKRIHIVQKCKETLVQE